MTFQEEVDQWVIECFGNKIRNYKQERNFRFLEESLELVQSLDMSKEDCLKLIEYVYNRPKGTTANEIGGVMLTFCALANCNSMIIDTCSNFELNRVYEKLEKIREKNINGLQPHPSDWQDNLKEIKELK